MGRGGGGALFKGQDSRVCLQAVSTEAEVEVDGQMAVLFLFSFAADLWWPKRLSRDLDVCPTYILEYLEQIMQ